MSDIEKDKSSHCEEKKRKPTEGIEFKLKKRRKWERTNIDSDEEHFGSVSDQEDLAEGWISNKECTSFSTSNIEHLASSYLIKSSKVKAVFTSAQEVATEVD